MARQASEQKRQEWVDRLDRHQASGLSVAAFCRQDSISEANFYLWKRKLKGGRPSSPPSLNGRVRSQSSSTKPRFVELRSPPRPSSHVEVTMAHGMVIRVPANQLDAVAAVAQAFASACIRDGERGHA